MNRRDAMDAAKTNGLESVNTSRLCGLAAFTKSVLHSFAQDDQQVTTRFTLTPTKSIGFPRKTTALREDFGAGTQTANEGVDAGSNGCNGPVGGHAAAIAGG